VAEWAAWNAPAIERPTRRYQRAERSSRRIVPRLEGSEDPCCQFRGTTAVDEVEQGVHVGPAVGGQGIGAPRLEAGALKPPPTPRHDGDQITVEARRM